MTRSVPLFRQPVAKGALPVSNALLGKARSVQRSCAACRTGKPDEKCPACDDNRTLGIVQRELTVGAPDDPLEKEAEEVADKVMRMPASCDDLGQRAHGKENPQLLRRLPASASVATPPQGFAAQLDAEPAGRPLPASARSFFEPRLGRFFGHVRIHDGPSANALASDINARAFTRGSDIYFADRQYDSSSTSGRRLIAHELAHVAQQSSDSQISPKCLDGPAAGPSMLKKLEMTRDIMCSNVTMRSAYNRIATDKIGIATFMFAVDTKYYQNGATKAYQLPGVEASTDPTNKCIYVKDDSKYDKKSADALAMNLYHELQHWSHHSDKSKPAPTKVQSEIAARIATEQLAIDTKRPPTFPSYRTKQGKVDTEFIKKDIEASPHYNPKEAGLIDTVREYLEIELVESMPECSNKK